MNCPKCNKPTEPRDLKHPCTKKVISIVGVKNIWLCNKCMREVQFEKGKGKCI